MPAARGASGVAVGTWLSIGAPECAVGDRQINETSIPWSLLMGDGMSAPPTANKRERMPQILKGSAQRRDSAPPQSERAGLQAAHTAPEAKGCLCHASLQGTKCRGPGASWSHARTAPRTAPRSLLHGTLHPQVRPSGSRCRSHSLCLCFF